MTTFLWLLVWGLSGMPEVRGWWLAMLIIAAFIAAMRVEVKR